MKDDDLIKKLEEHYNVTESGKFVEVGSRLSPAERREIYSKLPRMIYFDDVINSFIDTLSVSPHDYLVDYITMKFGENHPIHSYVFLPYQLAEILAKRKKENRIAPEITYAVMMINNVCQDNNKGKIPPQNERCNLM